MKKIFLIKIIITMSFMTGCASRSISAPIVEATAAEGKAAEEHIVRPGETLYSIALKYDLNYKKLSIINGISFPYAIHPGQKLALKGTVGKAPQKVAIQAPQPTPKPKPERLKYSTPKVNEVPPSASSARRISWRWPVKGKVLEKFDPKAGLNKGIDIQGKLGESVMAAADGLVVYSGSGLRGYGKLIIVKHSQDFLSAYAHNDQLFVSEGDLVKAGQAIAKLSIDTSNAPKLHFEIRANGEPVNPLQYLPR